MSAPAERPEADRHAKQRSIRRQVKAGKLIVRQMTPEERAKFPVPEAERIKNLGP